MGVCRDSAPIFSKAQCESAAPYCRWLNDAPAWFRHIANQQDLYEYAKWLKEQEALKKNLKAEEEAREASTYIHPGNPVVGAVIKPPERRWFIDPEHVEGDNSQAAWTNYS
jgi:hypothetical protein